VARKPDPNLAERQRRLADTLTAVTKTAEELRTAEQDLEQARERFRETLREAHAGGASQAMLGRLLGLSRQRVAQLLAEK
jgi:F0F1-type ATP synthase membrane subunit b/b'